MTVLLLGVIGVFGVVASNANRQILTEQIDRNLVNFASRGPAPQRPGPGPGPGDEPFLRTYAELLVDPDGTVVYAKPSGFGDQPDPLPDMTGLPGEEGLINLSSVDGTIEYRAFVGIGPDGLMAVVAAPLREVAEANSALIQWLLLTGGGVLLIGGAATWLTVRRAMAPVDAMIDTASAIAGGDLTQRVPVPTPGTELGRLGAALNSMMIHIEEAVETEREGQERLRRFVADASHELRTPLATISGYAELKRQGGLSDPEVEAKAWSRIESEGQRMGNLVRDLLTLARLDRTHPLRLEEVDLVSVLTDAVADHATLDPSRPISLEAPPSLIVRVDRERIQQVITNLLANSRVHTPMGTAIEVGLEHVDGTARLTVTDDGAGIPTDSLPNLFDRFYRADPSRSRHSGGSGLGLAIVAAIVAAHGGTVAADNVNGGGARFEVRLPNQLEQQ
jgi:two-component system OmpR family sensor kinase